MNSIETAACPQSLSQMLSPHQSPAAKGEEKHREPLLCAGNQVRRNLCFLFNAMKEQPASVYFDRRKTRVSAFCLAQALSNSFAVGVGSVSRNRQRHWTVVDAGCTHKGREQVLKERISSLFRELQGIASENKDREHLLQRYRVRVSEILGKLVLEDKRCIAEWLAMIIRFQEDSRR